MAVHSEYPNDSGLTVFDQWSQRGEAYKPAAVRSMWRSLKPGGGVNVRTLLFLAAAQGFDLKAHAPAEPETPAQVATRKREAADKAKRDADALKAIKQAGTAAARARWNAGAEHGESAYLVRKLPGVVVTGVRYQGSIGLVPMFDAASDSGEVCNVQRIGADGLKLYEKGAAKSGLLHWRGDPNGANVLCVAEGFATAESVRAATGYVVAVAFDCGNLPNVATAIRKRYPSALIVIAADDDYRTKGNPGATAGAGAAQSVAGVFALPLFAEPRPDGATDFNDLHHAEGLDAVKTAIEKAIHEHQAHTSEAAIQTHVDGNAATGDPEDARAIDRIQQPMQEDQFTSDGAGVWFHGRDRDGKTRPPEWVCSPLSVESLTRDEHGGGWGYLLKFSDALGHAKQWPMPARLLSGDGAEMRSALLSMGLRIAPGARARNLLSSYLQTRRTDRVITATERVGWHGGAYVLPTLTIAPQGAETIVFQGENFESAYRQRGTVAQWCELIASQCVGNSRLGLAVSLAFAGPVLRMAGMEGGGLHYRGDSSAGKSTAVRVAASVWGGVDFVRSWRSTGNALEGSAAMHNDGLLVLDELGELDASEAGQTAYMLANGEGKNRAQRTGLPRPRLRWRLLFLSTGELSLSQHASEAKQRTRAGQELRMLDIPADAGAGMGLFEKTHGADSPADFANLLTHRAGQTFGAVGVAWVRWLVDNHDQAAARIIVDVARITSAMCPEAAVGQVERAARRFAVIAAAGEMATSAGLTGWPKGEAETAARQCFNAWLAARPGGVGAAEDATILAQVRGFFAAHGEGRFQDWVRSVNADDAAHAPRTLQRAGYRRRMPDAKAVEYAKASGSDDGEASPTFTRFYVFKDIFKGEVCNGFDPLRVLRLLADRDHLITGTGGRYDRRERLPAEGMVSVYVLDSSVLSDD